MKEKDFVNKKEIEEESHDKIKEILNACEIYY